MTHIRTIPDAEASGELAQLYRRIRAAYRGLLGREIPTPGPYRSPSLLPGYARFGIAQAEAIIARRQAGPHSPAPDLIVDFAISIYSSCFYCSESNGAQLAEFYPGLDGVGQLLTDPQSAPIPPSHRAVFAWAETFARRSWTFTEHDLNALRRVGMDDGAIVHMAVKGAIQTWMMMMADGVGVPLETGAETGPGVGRRREDYHSAPAGLTAAGRGLSAAEQQGPTTTAAPCWVTRNEDTTEFRAAARWAEARYGAVPNLFRALSLAPFILPIQRMGLELLERPQSETLTPRQHAMVRVLVTSLNRCRYSRETAWRALVTAGGEEELLERLSGDHSRYAWNERDRVILDFAAKAVRNAYKIVRSDAQAFRDVGLGDEAYLDVLCTTALQTAADRLANALGVTHFVP